jgi:transmembrane sensor
MSQPNEPGDRTADAIDCFQCLTDPDADPRLRARWAAWLGESDENRAAYHAVKDTWARPVPRDAWPTHEEILNDTYDGDAPIVTRPAARKSSDAHDGAKDRTSNLGPPLAWVAGALVIAVLIVGGWQRLQPGQSQPAAVAYRTGRGEIRPIQLTDGSTITLGPLSAVSVTETASRRSARLDSGEALLSIAHDPARPFTLSANGGEIADIGTTFGVSVKPDRVVVTVVDGVVSVTARGKNPSGPVVTLQHDRQVAFSQELGPTIDVDGHAETGWARGRLAYVDQPLADVVADLTRYTTRDIAIGDPAAGALHYTGTIEADAIEQWIVALTRVYPVAADRSGSRIILRSIPAN